MARPCYGMHVLSYRFACTRTKRPTCPSPMPCCQVPMLGCSGLRVQYLRVVERKQGSAYKVDLSASRCMLNC